LLHRPEDWRVVLEPVVARYRERKLRRYFRADAAFAKPEIYEALEERGVNYVIRIPANKNLELEIADILFRPAGRPSAKPLGRYESFRYQAASWSKPRRIVAKVEHHAGGLFPRVGVLVTNMTLPSRSRVRFYNKRGTAEQWIKEGKNAVKWTRLPCHDFADNQVRLQLFALAYNLGNFLRRLALPQSVKHWSLTTLREKLVKIGAKVVTHARYVTFQMAEVAISRQLFKTILRRISRLGPVSPVPI